MPLWKVYHPVGAYSAQDKKEFAEKVTAMYSGIPIPKFYVVMIFEEVAADSLYVGGASHAKFVRLHLEHILFGRDFVPHGERAAHDGGLGNGFAELGHDDRDARHDGEKIRDGEAGGV